MLIIATNILSRHINLVQWSRPSIQEHLGFSKRGETGRFQLS